MNGKAERFAEFHARLREYQMRTWAAAQPIEGQVTEAFAVIDLEKQFEEELGCEFQHIHTTCTIEVTHLIRWCQAPFRVCTAGAESEREVIRDAVAGCKWCGRPVPDCWKVVPFG